MAHSLDDAGHVRYSDLTRVMSLLRLYVGNDPSEAFSAPSLHELLTTMEQRTRDAEGANVALEKLLEQWEGMLPAVRSKVLSGPIRTARVDGRSVTIVTEDGTREGLKLCPPGPPST